MYTDQITFIQCGQAASDFVLICCGFLDFLELLPCWVKWQAKQKCKLIYHCVSAEQVNDDIDSDGLDVSTLAL